MQDERNQDSSNIDNDTNSYEPMSSKTPPEIAIDITPGRKFMSSIAMAIGFKYTRE
ncbi:MAG: hypothetical protein ACTSR8_21640 [Promethearchaeota archaeon]